MKDEVVTVFDDGFGDVLVDFVLGIRVNTGDVRPLELEELPPQSQVDTRRLNLQFRVVEGFDNERAVLESVENVRIGEDHMSALEWPVLKRIRIGLNYTSHGQKNHTAQRPTPSAAAGVATARSRPKAWRKPSRQQ